jgi:hypothetical protein
VDFPHFDARSDGVDGLDLPRPIRSGLAVAAVGLLPLALGLAAVIRPLSGLVLAAIFLAAGALQLSLAHFELIGIRRSADLELRLEPRPLLLSSFAQWRARELTSDRHRLSLARAAARTERDLSPALLPGASPLNRVAARPHAELFRQLADRLAALDRPVNPQTILQVEELLTSPESPLYARERARELRASLLACLDALDAMPERRRPIPTGGNRESPLPMTTNGHRSASLKEAQSSHRKGK